MEATKDVLIRGAPLRVWVTLVPPGESIQWLNVSNCSKCPTEIPYMYGSDSSGIFCCTNKTEYFSYIRNEYDQQNKY